MLFHGHAFRQIPRLVYVAAAANSDVTGEELEGDDFEDGQQEFGAWGMYIVCSTKGSVS